MTNQSPQAAQNVCSTAVRANIHPQLDEQTSMKKETTKAPRLPKSVQNLSNEHQIFQPPVLPKSFQTPKEKANISATPEGHESSGGGR